MEPIEGYETWQAMHAECPVEADCCVLLPDMEITPKIKQAAALRGMSVEAFCHMALSKALR